MSDQWATSEPPTTPTTPTTTPPPTPPATTGSSGASSPTAQTAKDEAGNVASTAKDSGTQVASTAKDQGQRVVSETTQQARNLMGETRSQVQQQASTQQQRAVGNLRSIGDELESMAGSSEQSGMGSQLVRQASEQVKQVAGWLDSRDPQGLLEDIRDFARRRPGAFLFGATAAGMVAGRLTRAGVDVKRQQSMDTGDLDQYRASTMTSDPTAYDTGMAGYPTGAEPGSPEEPSLTGRDPLTPGVPPTVGTSGVGAGTAAGPTTPVNPYPGAHRTGDDLVDPEGPQR